jgi:hypothetical protein
MISGAVQARVSIAWCSDIQKRLYLNASTSFASSIELWRACAGVLPSGTGDWSSTDNRSPFTNLPSLILFRCRSRADDFLCLNSAELTLKKWLVVEWRFYWGYLNFWCVS